MNEDEMISEELEIDEFYEMVESGLNGDNWGMPMGMPKLESLIDGVTQKTLSLVFGESGSGKSSFVLYCYVYRPLMDNLDNDNYNLIYFSLELGRPIILAKLMSMYIYETYGHILSMKDIFSKRKNKKLSDIEYKYIKDSKKWLQKILKKITIYDKAINSDLFAKKMKAELEKRGKFKETDNNVIYIPNNKKQVFLGIVDHMALLQGKTKEEIDKTAQMMIQFRRICGTSFTAVMQANRDVTSMDRRKSGFMDLQRSDVRDSSSVEQACDVMIGIFDPIRQNLKTHKNYQCDRLKNVYKSIQLLKSRYDTGDMCIAAGFYGSCGIWKELPKPDEMEGMGYDSYMDVDWKRIDRTSDSDNNNTSLPTKSTLGRLIIQ